MTLENMKWSKIHVIGVIEGNEGGKGARKTLLVK